jgi:uncharacterized protein YfaS (alpha-2-macroglobulin family)
VRARSSLGAVILVASSVIGCGGKKGGDAPPPPPKVISKDTPPGLDLRLSNGKSGAPAYDRASLAPATKLDAPEVTQLLARAKPLVAEPADLQAFAIRPGSAPPPRTGQVVSAPFPPPVTNRPLPTAERAGKGLAVLRWMPEGEVPLAPELSITFSQPMVAVTSQDDAASVQPVVLSPQPKGKWRWIGTRTILFDPEIRFPQATTYTVTVPAGTKSATGETLAAAKTFTFETPTAKLVSSFPSSGPQQLDVPIYLLFDQKIDPQAVLAKLRVKVNGTARATRLVTEAEIEKSHDLKTMVAAAKADEQTGRWIALRTKDKLPPDAQIDVEIPDGTPSAEGPNKTKTLQKLTFRTYPPFKVVESECGWGGNAGCRPRTPLRIELNNPVDVDAFDPSQVKVSPAIPDVQIVPSGAQIMVTGTKQPRTAYSVTVSPKIKDQFGQTLGTEDKRTFLVGDPDTEFYGPSDMVVLDPMAKGRTLDFFTSSYKNLKVRLYKVTAADYEKFIELRQTSWRKDKPPVMPGTKVFDAMVPVKNGTGILSETNLDLSPALDANGFGHVIAFVQPSPWNDPSPPPELVSWVQATHLGIDAHVDADGITAYASELDSGKPAGDVKLELRSSGSQATTAATGLATLPLNQKRDKSNYLIATRGPDSTFVTESNGYYGSASWVREDNRRSVELTQHILDDRSLYRPGEDVAIKGWLRWLDFGKGGDIRPLDGKITSLSYVVHDAQRVEIAKGTATVSALGGFDARFTLPKTPNLGYARIELTPVGPGADPTMGFAHSIRIEEFRRPEFEVNAHASDGPFLVGGGGDMTVSAKYFTGAALPGAKVTWAVSASSTSYTPPNRDDYTFGTWTPWWGDRGGGKYSMYDDDEAYYGGRYGGGNNRGRSSWSLEGKTDAVGGHVLHLDFLSSNPAVPMSVSATASVTDVNRQTWSASTALVVHPASLYVGLKSKRPFVEKGEPFDLDVIGVDIDGKIAGGSQIALTAVRLDWEYVKGEYKQKEVEPQQCAVTIATDAGRCTFTTAKGGSYRVTATITDPKGHQNQSTLEFRVSGGEGLPSRDVSEERVEMIPDKKDYSPGNTAEVLIQAPFYPAEGVLSWRRSGIVKLERITFDGPTKVITVPITDAMTPNLHVHVALVGMSVRTDDRGVPDPKQPKRPAFATGTIDLPIPPRHRTLNVVITPAAAKVSPAEKTSVSLEIRDAEGKPVADAEAAVIVVDESVLALANASYSNPVDTFHRHREDAASDRFSRAAVRLSRPPATQTAGTQTAPGAFASLGATGDISSGFDDSNVYGGLMNEEESGGTGTAMALEEGKMGKKDSDRAEGQYRMRRTNEDGKVAANGVKNKPPSADPEPNTPIAIRSNFNPLAAFAPSVRTDASGKAKVDIAMPDNLTRYRVIAIAVAGTKQFGKGESAITARLPLMVKPSAPRFLNFGDTFQLPVVVQNQTDAPMTVKLAIVATNLSLTDGTGRAVTVPANDRVEVQFPAAAEMAGTARLQIVGTAGNNSDAAEIAIPVWTPATTEAFATYGVIDDGATAQPIALPGKVIPTFGGLEITAASTNLQSLTDAMLYLVHYPFDCAEQRSSRILGIAALRDVLEAFKVTRMPSRAAMETSVAADLEHLSQMQNSDGGFAYWERGYKSEPYLTVHVANALARAKAKGYPVPKQMIEQALAYLKAIWMHFDTTYSDDVKRSIAAYALYTRKLLGDLDIAAGQKLIADAGGIEKLQMETNGWLLSLFAGNPAAAEQRKAIVQYALNHVSETAGAANFTTSYGDGAYLLLASEHRVDAIMLEALILEQPALDLIPKIVTGLMAHRTEGRWINTQESTFVLLALELYFRTYEKVTPNFVARIWLGADYAGELAFRGRSTKYFQVSVPMSVVATHDNQNLTIQKDGAGRLYYRLGMRYAPASLSLAAADYGFVVERRYEGVDNPADVTRAADGIWHIKAGARVRVRISLVNENRRYHVALVDPLPAGLEILNPELAGQAPIPDSVDGDDDGDISRRGRYSWWYGPWYEHQNLRDERAEAFTQQLWEGVHKYEYVTRATTPGTFIVPPPKAEEMYMPETFGRGASDKVIVQ